MWLLTHIITYCKYRRVAVQGYYLCSQMAAYKDLAPGVYCLFSFKKKPALLVLWELMMSLFSPAFLL